MIFSHNYMCINVYVTIPLERSSIVPSTFCLDTQHVLVMIYLNFITPIFQFQMWNESRDLSHCFITITQEIISRDTPIAGYVRV